MPTPLRMKNIELGISHIQSFLADREWQPVYDRVKQCHRDLIARTGKGNDFLGWIDLPLQEEALVSRILDDASRIRKMARLFVVIGIGGSYLGSKAVIDALGDPFLPYRSDTDAPRVVFAGENLSGEYHARLLRLLDANDYAVAVISKSGTTTEPAVAFRLIRQHLEKKYGKEGARERIFAVTDASRGALKNLADAEGYTSYVIPDDVGGRFSVLTPVGLLPIAVAGFDIRALLEGARAMRTLALQSDDPAVNPCVQYAAARNMLLQAGFSIEILAAYEPGLASLVEWWKQLYGESEGKEHKGIFPAGVNFTTDLHSMGQYIQEGKRNLFETVLSISHTAGTLAVPADPGDADGLNFLTGMPLSEVNRMAALGTLLAHVDGGVPVMTLGLPTMNEHHLGELIYFFEFACALSGYTLGVNPFDQPGVEAYKKNMFALLGKPGYGPETKQIRERLTNDE